MSATVIVTDEFVEWYDGLDEDTQEAIGRVVGQLERQGTTLGFPQSSAIAGSRLALRELRVQHMGQPYRVLYIFDPKRQAVLLVGGNKVGKGNRWYDSAIAQAESVYAEYLSEFRKGMKDG